VPSYLTTKRRYEPRERLELNQFGRARLRRAASTPTVLGRARLQPRHLSPNNEGALAPDTRQLQSNEKPLAGALPLSNVELESDVLAPVVAQRYVGWIQLGERVYNRLEPVNPQALREHGK